MFQSLDSDDQPGPIRYYIEVNQFSDNKRWFVKTPKVRTAAKFGRNYLPQMDTLTVCLYAVMRPVGR